MSLGFRSERALLTVRTAWTKTKENPHSHRAGKVILAMQLLEFEPRGMGQGVTYTEPITQGWTGGSRILIPEEGSTFQQFALDDLKATLVLAELIPDEVFEGPKTPLGIALHRFRSAAAATAPADAVIDFTTALEIVLLKDDKELSFKFALFGAYYLGSGPAERRELFKNLRSVYNLRSGLVHGSLSPRDMAKLVPARALARRITGRVLLNVLQDGMPTSSELTDLVLS